MVVSHQFKVRRRPAGGKTHQSFRKSRSEQSRTLPEKMRLQRMMALATELSRRAAEDSIKMGEVTVNGAIVTKLGTTVDPRKDVVTFRGKKIFIADKLVYIIYHKPRGYLVTKSDPEGRATIWDQLKDWKGKLNSVGRLDFDSSGLMVLTNDGDLINGLTHPKHEVWKTYRVWVRGEPSADDIAKLQSGVSLDGEKTLPARVTLMQSEKDNSLLEVAIREGKNRQVRRMFETIGFTVRSLERVSIGKVNLKGLSLGKWRFLRRFEIESLKESAKS